MFCLQLCSKMWPAYKSNGKKMAKFSRKFLDLYASHIYGKLIFVILKLPKHTGNICNEAQTHFKSNLKVNNSGSRYS